jgi:uncharacterized membrane protein YbaN (DUF454 family)
MTKKWYTSKTIWLGIVAIAIGILEVVYSWLETASFTVADFIVLAIGILTVVLRFLTSTPIRG